MKIIEPSVELWKQENDIAHAVRCARVCYKRESGNDEATYKRLIESKHYSVFRHASYYYIINKNKGYHKIIDTFINIVDSKLKIVGIDIKYDDRNIYIVVNGQFLLEHPSFINAIRKYQVDEDTFKNTEIGFNMLRYTFKVVTQISTSRELNRVSPNNIAEQSTRYVYEDGTICRPHWMTDEEVNYLNNKPIFIEWCDIHEKAFIYIESCNNSFDKYRLLVNKGMHRQDARGVLPLDTATVCVYTYSIDEWRHILDLRYYGTTGKPHQNAKLIAGMIKNNLMELGYNFRD
jgi:thymidylate synthase ThyX